MIKLNNFKIGNSERLTIFGGVNVIESKELIFEVAEEFIKNSSKFKFNFVFKASFDKANRSSLDSYRGPGLEDGLKILSELKQKYNLPILTDIHEPHQAKPVSEDQVKKTISLLGVDLGLIIKSTEKSDDEIDFFPFFSEWMRLCYKTDIEGVCKWVDSICAEGRQRQKQFISYSIKIIRDCLIYNFANHTLLKVTNQEKNFLEKFAPFVNEENTIIIAEQLERVGVNLERNGSSKILFFELSLQMTKNLKLKRKFVKK